MPELNMNELTDKQKMEYAIFKFNSGMGALLCSGCRVILKTGSQMTQDEIDVMTGKKPPLPPYYCENCNPTEDLNNLLI